MSIILYFSPVFGFSAHNTGKERHSDLENISRVSEVTLDTYKKAISHLPEVDRSSRIEIDIRVNFCVEVSQLEIMSSLKAHR